MAKVEKHGNFDCLLIVEAYSNIYREMFKDILPFLNYSQSIGLKPATLDRQR